MQDHVPATSDQGSAAAPGETGADPMSADEQEFVGLKSAVLAKLTLGVGKDPSSATDRDWFVAAALTARDRIIHRWLAADRTSRGKYPRRPFLPRQVKQNHPRRKDRNEGF